MFKDIEVHNNADGTATVIINLSDDQLKMMEDVLGVPSDKSLEFEKAFGIFINQAIQSFIQG